MVKHIHGGNVYSHKDCIDFSANCNPLGTPAAVKQAVIDCVDSLEHYPRVGCAPLCEAVAKYEGVKTAQVQCGNGAADLIFTLCRTLKPKKALLPGPTFAEYEQALESVECEIIKYELKEETEFRLQQDYLERLTPDLDILFLCNPNNPTGMLTQRAFLIEVLKKCHENNIFMVVDECFLDFVKNEKEYTLKDYLEEYKNLFLLKAFTKRYAIPGIRLGYCLCGNRELLDKMELCAQPWNVSTIAQEAGLAALKEEAYVQAGRKLVFEEAAYLKQEMRAMGIKVFDSQANYIFFKGSENLYEECLKRQVLIRDCSNYFGLTKGFFRIAVKKHEDNQKLIGALREVTEGGMKNG